MCWLCPIVDCRTSSTLQLTYQATVSLTPLPCCTSKVSFQTKSLTGYYCEPTRKAYRRPAILGCQPASLPAPLPTLTNTLKRRFPVTPLRTVASRAPSAPNDKISTWARPSCCRTDHRRCCRNAKGARYGYRHEVRSSEASIAAANNDKPPCPPTALLHKGPTSAGQPYLCLSSCSPSRGTGASFRKRGGDIPTDQPLPPTPQQ
jgi:hypothetical protein